MPGNNRKRQCKTCKVMFASPAAWVKHRDSMGYCRPVTTYAMLNLDYRNGAWCVKVRKSAKR